jgi:hypothetical protein
MREIDFLPAWYRQRRRRQSYAQRQYAALGLLFLVMILWNSFATRDISMASAELSWGETQRIRAQNMSLEYRELHQRLLDLRKKLDVRYVLNEPMDVAATMARLSKYMPEGVVLRELHLTALAFTDPTSAERESQHISSTSDKGPCPNILHPGPVRFEVVIGGQTTDTQAIALLLSDLEGSAFFTGVHLRYMRSAGDGAEARKTAADADDTTTRGGPGVLLESTEFEIRCQAVFDEQP